MATLARRLRRRASSERGNTLIETAFVLPILLLVIAGIMDFGFLFLQYEVVTNAAREGARVGVLPNYESADIDRRVRDYLVAGGLPAPPTTGITYSTQALPGGLSVNIVSVTVQYPGRFLFLGPISALVSGGPYGNVTLRASSVMRQEQ